MSKSYDQQGFLITSSPTSSSTTKSAGGVATSLGAGIDDGIGGKAAATRTSKAAASKETSAWRGFGAIGIAAAVAAEGLLL